MAATSKDEEGKTLRSIQSKDLGGGRQRLHTKKAGESAALGGLRRQWAEGATREASHAQTERAPPLALDFARPLRSAPQPRGRDPSVTETRLGPEPHVPHLSVSGETRAT